MKRMIQTSLLLCGLIFSSCDKEVESNELTSFNVPELVHVYGGHPFTLPIVQDTEGADISTLEFTHPDDTNFKLDIRGDKAVIKYIPLEENDKIEERSETLRVGNEKLGYKDVVVHVASQPISAAFLLPYGVADIYDGAVLKIDGNNKDGVYSFGIIAAANCTGIDGKAPELAEEEFSCTVEAPDGKILSQEGAKSGAGHILALSYTKDVEGFIEVTYNFTDRYSVSDKDFVKEYTLSFAIESW